MSGQFFVRDCWYVAGLSGDFQPEKLTGHVIAEKPIVIWRTKDGEVVAYDDRCSHKRFPLSKGRLMPDGTLECAYHGMRYDTSGKCVMIPSHPSGPISPQATVRAFPVVEQDGLVWIWPGDPARSQTQKPPRVPEIGHDEWESVCVGPMDVQANYLLLIENLLDITHFYPLHDGNIGDIANSRIPIELEEGEEDGNSYVMTVRKTSDYKQPPYLEDWFHYPVVDRHHTHCMMSPALTRVVMRNAPPGQLQQRDSDREFPGRLDINGVERGYVLVHTLTPVDERNHIWRIIVNCPAKDTAKGDPTKSTAKRIAEMFPAVAAEDLWAVAEQQKMFDYPDDGYSEVFLKPDLALRRARKIMTDMLRQEQQAATQTHAAE
ncbi:MAG TPA: Rieske 2Fe-2S domain-containing protein [Hyphomicrobiaceae bacterium]|nr:Rieske 2Fe-2S domain-containing protein [Hyphomicrobiaceae bacterium]